MKKNFASIFIASMFMVRWGGIAIGKNDERVEHLRAGFEGVCA